MNELGSPPPGAVGETELRTNDTTCFDVFRQCANAVDAGELIRSVSARDKEFHFQNWFRSRLERTATHFDQGGRNSYPDFTMVEHAEGYEVKGLAWPGRVRNYDANSRMPSGRHNGRRIFYVFGRYPEDLGPYPDQGDGRQYPVIDLVMCHGSFLNADHEYVHKNKSVKGFGTYGDVLIRDRKMYVAPTPFALTEGTTGLMTLIVPEKTVAPTAFKRLAALLAPKPPSWSSPTGSTCVRTNSRPSGYPIRTPTPSTASSRTGSTTTRPNR